MEPAILETQGNINWPITAEKLFGNWGCLRMIICLRGAADFPREPPFILHMLLAMILSVICTRISSEDFLIFDSCLLSMAFLELQASEVLCLSRDREL